jgi:hypothetical protein
MMLWVLFHAHKYRFDPSTLRPIDPSTHRQAQGRRKSSGQAEKLRAGGKAQGRRKGSGQAEKLRAGGKAQGRLRAGGKAQGRRKNSG